MLYVADEVFFCGTAAEVTPIISVDKVTTGELSTAKTAFPNVIFPSLRMILPS